MFTKNGVVNIIVINGKYIALKMIQERKENMNISFDTSDLILEVKEDIRDYGLEYKCYLYYKRIEGINFCIDYALEEDIEGHDCFKPGEGEFRVESTLGKALEILENENKII